MQISFDVTSVKSAFLKIYQSAAVRLGFAIALIAGIYWWMTRTQAPSLMDRVTKLEADVEGFWLRVSNRAIYNPRIISENVWIQRAQWDLKQIQREIQSLPQAPEGSPLAGRIKKLHETAACKMSSTVDTPSKNQKDKTVDVKELSSLDWTQRVDEYEKRSDIQAEELKQYQAALVAQINEVFKHKPTDELFTCLVRVHRVGRRWMLPGKKLENVKALVSEKNGGLQRNGNNSCYLAAAIQLFRCFDALKSQFDPNINRLNNQLAQRIQNTIHSMLIRMDNGETIPADEGIALQGLLKEAGVLTGDLFEYNDAGEIAAAILYRMGYEFPTGVHIKELKGQDPKTIQDPDYRPVIATFNGSVDVGLAIKSLTEKKTENVENYGQQVEYVQELPEFMFVDFLNPSTLVNVERFDDPLNPYYEYELVFAMENTGGHWVAHMKGNENQWKTANDDSICTMQEGALSHIHRGYYLRKYNSSKFLGVD